MFNGTYDDVLNVFITAYEYVADTEEASDSVASSFEGLSPRVADDSERAQMLREMQEMQERIHSVFSGKFSLISLHIGVAPIKQYTHMRNKKTNTQGSSPYVVKVIFHTTRNCS